MLRDNMMLQQVPTLVTERMDTAVTNSTTARTARMGIQAMVILIPDMHIQGMPILRQRMAANTDQ